MKYLNKKSYYLLFTFICTQVVSKNAELRFAVGSAWYEFYAINDFNKPFGTIEQEAIQHDLTFMPYVQGSALYANKHRNIRLSAGSGAFKKANFVINSTLPDPLIPQVSSSISTGELRGRTTTVQLTTGMEFQVHESDLYINPLVGYIYNNQKLVFKNLAQRNRLNVNSTWQGLLLGLEALLKLQPSWTLRASYQGIIGESNVSFLRDFVLLATNTNTGPYYGKIKAFGNIFQVDFNYYYSPRWNLGFIINYLSWRNHHDKKLNVQNPKEPGTDLLLSINLRRIFWEQLLALAFIEYTF